MNNKLHKIKVIASAFMALCVGMAVVSCAGSAGGNNSAGSQAKIAGQCNSNKAKNNMKLTKEMFYKDGKFDEAAAKKAYIEMMENLGYPISDNLRENMWVSDFALGDFPRGRHGRNFLGARKRARCFRPRNTPAPQPDAHRALPCSGQWAAG